jgi:hypothetical protein
LNKDEQSFFDYNLRTKLGLSGASSKFIDVFSLDPSLLKIDMFSPDELLNSGDSYINYYGYDIAGNKVAGNTNINDYFTKYDEKTKNYERKVGAFQPIYVSGYLMDKFAFNDLVFNVGVRVDVFDANQPVLKDPYLFYTAKTVNEVLNDKNLPFKAEVPSNIGGDYTVYVDDVKNPTKINGYRLENNWYDAKGAVVEDPKVLRGAAGIAPLLQNPSNDSKTGTWNPSTLDYSIIGTTVYTFTPTTGLCATTTTLTAVINPNTTPTFTQVPPICSGSPLNPLPTSTIEGITGTWSPALNNLATTTYTFTPTAGLCAVSTTMVITVNPNITPTFTAIPPLCVGETAPSLPITSIEGITGNWSPTSIDNTISGIYTFTPGINECATIGSLSVTVQDGFDFEIEGSCVDNDFILEVKVLIYHLA